MKITHAMLEKAEARGIIDHDQRDALWHFLGTLQADTPSFRPAHILYYAGGLIAIGAMTLFMTLGWESFGGMGLMLIALCYAAIAIGVTEWLCHDARLAIPAGITATLAVVMVPLAVYGLQHLLGLWPEGLMGERANSYRGYHQFIDWRWIFMEFATLAAGALALWRYRLPFIMMPLAVTLWYMSMDLVPLLLGGEPAAFFSPEGKRITLGFGLAMLVVALWVDVRMRATRDFAFWLYIFGVLTFWGALSSSHSGDPVDRAIYCAINVAMIAVGAMLSRRIFAVCGGVGVAGYLGWLSWTVFHDSLTFPVVLTALGLTIIYAGYLWQRNEAIIGARLRAVLPTALRQLLDARAA